jgi:hypothetical protein
VIFKSHGRKYFSPFDIGNNNRLTPRNKYSEKMTGYLSESAKHLAYAVEKSVGAQARINNEELAARERINSEAHYLLKINLSNY